MKLILWCILSLNLLVYGYRPESILSVAHVLSGDDLDPNDPPSSDEAKEAKQVGKEETEGPHGTNLKDKEPKEGEEPEKDCFWHRKAIRNWDVRFQSIEDVQKRMEDAVRLQSETPNTQDTWGGLIKLDGNMMRLFMGVEVFFTETEKECAVLGEEDLRFSNSPDCEDTGIHLYGEAKYQDGKSIFKLMAATGTVVLKREEAQNEIAILGDWTFASGDFSIIKTSNGSLELQQKMWNKTVSFPVTQPESGGDFVVEMKVMNSECAKFKTGKCPDLCKDNGTMCEGHKVSLKVKKDNINEMIRTMDDKAPYDVKRSFMPVDADVDAFVCAKVANDTWMAIRGMSFKQMTPVDSNSQKVKDAQESKGMKVFESKTFVKKAWLQEKHIMTDGLSNPDGHQPPFLRAIEATVEWKKAMVCPEKFPVCFHDGDCVSEDCKNGCDWSKSPTIDGNEDLGYNWIAGADAHGTPCDEDSEVLGKKSSASGLSFAALLVTLSYQML